jgi:tRNA dimethylallyltransferase
VRLLALFGPTAVGKTAVAVAVAELLRERGEDPVAVSCDSIQVYQGLEILSGAAGAGEREQLEHRLLGIIPAVDEFSAGQYAQHAHREIDALLAEGRRPIVVGGTGLYLRAALTDLELRPVVPENVRRQVEREIEERGLAEMNAEVAPDVAASIHPNDRRRIGRALELQRAGFEPAPSHREGGRLWTAGLRHPTLLVGLTIDPALLDRRIDARVDAMVEAGAVEEVAEVERAGASRTARAAIGYDELLAGNVEATKLAQRRFARRQLTWMRRMEDVETIDRGAQSDGKVASRVLEMLGDDR